MTFVDARLLLLAAFSFFFLFVSPPPSSRHCPRNERRLPSGRDTATGGARINRDRSSRGFAEGFFPSRFRRRPHRGREPALSPPYCSLTPIGRLASFTQYFLPDALRPISRLPTRRPGEGRRIVEPPAGFTSKIFFDAQRGASSLTPRRCKFLIPPCLTRKARKRISNKSYYNVLNIHDFFPTLPFPFNLA